MSSSLGGFTGYQGTPGSQTGKFSYDKTPKGYKAGQLQQFTPEQMDLFQRSFGNVGPDSYLSRLAGGDEEIFNQIEGPAMKQFSQLQGGIASRFSGMGTGARKSSGFQNTINAASQDFASQLQAQRMGLQQQAIKDLHGMTQDLLGQRPFQRTLTEKPKSWWESILTSGGRAFAEQGGRAAGNALFGNGGSSGGGSPLEFAAQFMGG